MIFQAVIDGIIRVLALVASGRDMTVEQVDEIAGGKVWIGRQALEIGLVDELGSLNDAIVVVAELAGIEDYEAERFGTPISPQQLVLEELGKNLQVSMPSTVENAMVWLSPLKEPLTVLSKLQDPKHVYFNASIVTMLTNIDLPIEDRDGAVLAATILLVETARMGWKFSCSNATPMQRTWLRSGCFRAVRLMKRMQAVVLERAARGGLRELCEEADVSLDLDSLTTFSHWLTPAGQKRRFATWFFIAALLAEAAVKVDGEEMVEAAWMSPRDAVNEHRAGRLRLPPPLSACWMFLAAIACEAIQRVSKRQAPYFYPKFSLTIQTILSCCIQVIPVTKRVTERLKVVVTEPLG